MPELFSTLLLYQYASCSILDGAPYIWNYSEKALTFYYIAEENIQEVFEKTQYKVLKIASSLCGAIVESLMAKPDTIKGMSLE